MTKTYTFLVPMQPAAKARPRVTRGHAYMPDTYVKWKKEFLARCMSVYNKSPPIECKLCISIIFMTKNGKMRPDIDNALGACMDSLQGTATTRVIIKNDRQIVEIGRVYCVKSDEEKIMVTLTEVI
jgi:Holliday junction resolvase RusA-like endonuclease